MTTTETPRLPFYRLAPGIHGPLLALTRAAKKDLDPTLVELLLIRASQLNHCAFCLDMHVTDARKGGETDERIALLGAWEEATGLYSPKEQAALALTEAVTLLPQGGVPDEVYDRAAAHFEDTEIVRLLALITAINSWNRINVAARIPVGASLSPAEAARTPVGGTS
ncbi:carboxymuconolactone decarboxylase family protein [Streptomyces platensis]|uniref:carboxymuconolactone decarboxylase family protein n=1 Tax=Streptomyces platensis TaxID=58346 RepID=UPI002E81682A|nr:carboxymuconolactone decarboxylase family protein [Streptomyces platensis]WUB80246.1 carboxymuconolactone decarboxylase family protein [Streptomyces platensis]